MTERIPVVVAESGDVQGGSPKAPCSPARGRDERIAKRGFRELVTISRVFPFLLTAVRGSNRSRTRTADRPIHSDSADLAARDRDREDIRRQKSLESSWRRNVNFPID